MLDRDAHIWVAAVLNLDLKPRLEKVILVL